jgi:hypothetical protein
VTTDVNRIVSCPRVRSHAQYGSDGHEVSETGGVEPGGSSLRAAEYGLHDKRWIEPAVNPFLSVTSVQSISKAVRALNRAAPCLERQPPLGLALTTWKNETNG